MSLLITDIRDLDDVIKELTSSNQFRYSDYLGLYGNTLNAINKDHIKKACHAS